MDISYIISCLEKITYVVDKDKGYVWLIDTEGDPNFDGFFKPRMKHPYRYFLVLKGLNQTYILNRYILGAVKLHRSSKRLHHRDLNNL
jgi:hypothetical protein